MGAATVLMRALCLIAALLLISPLQAVAQQYPNKPLRLIVPFAAGGTTDVLARTVAEQLGASVKQAVIVENRTGGNSLVGGQVVASATPDGYTLLFVGGASLSTVFNKTVPFDFWTALTPVAPLYQGGYFLVVNSSFPANTFKEFLAYVKERPGKLNYGGFGGIVLATEALKAAAGLDVVHIPYKGSAPMTAALLSGEIQMAFDAIVSYRALIQAGRIKVLANGGATRSTEYPDVPTVAESGFPGFLTAFNGGVWAPAGTPRDSITLLNRELNVITRNPTYRERVRNAGAEVNAGSPEDLHRTIKTEIDFWTKVAAAVNFRPE